MLIKREIKGSNDSGALNEQEKLTWKSMVKGM